MAASSQDSDLERAGDNGLTKSEPPEQPKLMPAAQENLFLILITLMQLVQMIPLGAGINSGLAIGEALGASRIESAWITASYPLTQGTFVLMGGRLGAQWGHKYTLAIGCIIWTVWAFATGYAPNLVALTIMRGLTGVGGGIMIPNIVALIGITFQPGPKRNLGLALFGAMAPVGAAGGSLISAVLVQLAGWPWLFFFLGLLGSIVFTISLFICPTDEPVYPEGKIDWTGAGLGVTALILFNFTWNQAPSAGWGSPYEITLLIVSIALALAFCYWETKVAKDPILPFNIWSAPSFGPLLVVIFLSFMSIGIFFWYMNIYMQTIRGDTLIQVGVQYLPLTILGTVMAFVAAWLVSRVPAQVIICIGLLATVGCNLLVALVPERLTYWAMCFPAMILSACTIDLITTSGQIICNNSVPREYQGVAGSLVGTLLSYGMSTGLGFAGVVEVQTFGSGQTKEELLHGYHMAAYLAVGLAGLAFFLCAFFIRIPKDTRRGWDAEDSTTVLPEEAQKVEKNES